MRIAIVAESFLPRVNGVTNSVVRVATLLKAQGHSVRIIAPDKYTEDFFRGIKVERIKSLELPGIQATDLSFATKIQIREIFLNYRPDVIHLASPFVLGHKAIKIAIEMGIPTVAIFQTDVAGFATHYGLTTVSGFADKLIRKIHKRADLTLAPSQSSTDYLNGLGVKSVRYWGRGVDLEMFNPKWRTRSLDGVTRIGYLGRLAPEKSVHMLKHLENLPNTEIVVIGDGPEKTRLRSLLPDAEFMGQLGGNDLSQAVANLDVLVPTGEKETFCQVVQEGMAAGLAVVAPAIGGPADLIQHGENGLLYAPGSGQDLRFQVSSLITDKAEQIAIRDRAWLGIQSRSWEHLLGELIGHYDSVISKTDRTWSAV